MWCSSCIVLLWRCWNYAEVKNVVGVCTDTFRAFHLEVHVEHRLRPEHRQRRVRGGWGILHFCEGVDMSKSRLDYAPFVTDNSFRHILNELIWNFFAKKIHSSFCKTRIVLKWEAGICIALAEKLRFHQKRKEGSTEKWRNLTNP